MKFAARFGLVLLPALLLAGSPRFARIGEWDGSAEMQVHAADAWQAASRNAPLVESSWIRTPASSRGEIELDEGSTLRLVGESQAELSDYSRLSTGQRITLISLDHGLAYFTGEPKRRDSVTLAIPGAQVSLSQGSRLRLEVSDERSQVAVIEGVVRFSTPVAEMDLRQGQMVRLENSASGRFTLDREIPVLDSDRWSEDRDKAGSRITSLKYIPNVRFGLLDLDRNGVWVQSGDYGPVWKPKVPAEWVPFRDGKWEWYDELGYTWVSAETWGWMPYHYGRWLLDSSLGWIWAPGHSAIFKPGDVYWMRGNNLAGWGPLGIDETWTGTGPPRLYAAANTTFAKFLPGLREIDPATLASRPKDALAAAAFALALPSPPLVAARLDAVRPELRAGSTHVMPYVPGAGYEARAETATVATRVPEPETPPRIADQRPFEPQVEQRREQPVYVAQPEADSFYPVPVYTGIVIVNPPEREHRQRDHPQRNTPQNNTPQNNTPQNNTLQQQAPPARAPAPIHREHPEDRHPETSANRATSPKAEDKPSETAITRDPAARKSR